MCKTLYCVYSRGSGAYKTRAGDRHETRTRTVVVNDTKNSSIFHRQATLRTAAKMWKRTKTSGIFMEFVVEMSA